jgi:sulfate transport system permease protein
MAETHAAIHRRAHEDPPWVRRLVVTIAVTTILLLIAVPLANVFYEALRSGLAVYWHNLVGNPDTLAAIRLTLTVAPAAVLLNLVFGLTAAWAIARFRFPGRTLLTAFIDLPFAVSPVVVGLFLLLIFGRQGLLGPWLIEHDIKIVFATPGIILATAFVTFPVIARELIPLMEAVGADEEIAAVSLGARPWHLFTKITLPNIRWGLLFGVILCNARAMGEFGAVYVVSGRITGKTDTIPIRIEKLFQDYDMPAAFALASVLAFLALLTLLAQVALRWKSARVIAEGELRT